MYTKQQFIQKIRAKYPVYDAVSDDELFQKVMTKYPEYESQVMPEEETSVAKEVGQGIVDFSGAVVTGLDNFATDITNNTIGRITGIDYKPAREYIVPTGEEYKGGLLQRSINTISERGQDVADSLEYQVEGQRDRGQLEQLKRNAVGTYQGAGAVVGGVVDVFGDTVMSGLKTIAPDKIEEKIKATVNDKMQNTQAGQKVISLMNEYSENMEFLKKNDPDAYRSYKASFSYLSGLAEVVGVKKVAGIYRSGGEIVNIPTDKIRQINQEILNKAQEGVSKVAESMGGVKNKTMENVGSIFSNLPKPSKEYQKAVTTNGIEFEVEKTPGIFENMNDIVFKRKNQEMAVQSVFPKQTKEKGLNARLNSGKIALNSIEQLYNDKAKGIVTANINEMGGGVEGVEQALEYWGKQIGKYTDVDTTVGFTNEIATLKKSLDEKFAKLNPDMYNRVKKVVEEFESIGDEVSIKDLQKGISNIKSDIFSNFEVTKQLASTSTGKALGKLLDTLQDKFDATLDIATGGSKQLKEAKNAYSKYKKIQKDLTDSFIVAQRNAGKGLGGTAGKIGGAYEVLQNPSITGIMRGLLLKQSGELISKAKSRDGNWEMLMRNLDRQAVRDYKLKSKYVPKTDQRADNLPDTDNVNPDTSSMSDDISNMDTKGAISETEILEAVQDIADQIQDNLGNKEALMEIKEAVQEFNLPDRYKDILDEKLDNYIRDVEVYQKEMDAGLQDVSLDEIYGSGLTKAFNGLQGIEKRVVNSKFDKHNQVEFQDSPAYKKFSDSAQEFINERDSDMTVQELYEQMKDTDLGVKFQRKADNPAISEKQELIDEINEYGEAWDSDDNYFDIDDIDRIESEIKQLKKNGEIDDTLFHGGNSKIDFDDLDAEYKLGDNTIDPGTVIAEGPGYYFTSKRTDAEGYGKEMIELSPKENINIINDSDEMFSIKEMEDIIENMDDSLKLNMSENWSENFQDGLRQGIESAVENADTKHEQLMNIWADAFNHQGANKFIQLMKDADIDGVRISRGDDTFHTIIYNKEAFNKKIPEERFQESKTQSTGNGETIDPAEAIKTVRKYFAEKDLGVDVVEKIITPDGMEAFGKYRDKLITFAKNPIDSTPEHEVLHAYFDMMLDTKAQTRILNEVKKTEKFKSNLDAEEWLADNFVEFVRGRDVQGLSANIKKAFGDMGTSLKRIFFEGDVVDNVYRDLEKLSKPDLDISTKVKATTVGAIENQTGDTGEEEK